MESVCPECGAPLPESGDCREHLYALLAREARAPVGALAHFYAVACYVLQHPDSFGYTAAALAGLHRSLGDALDGRADVAALRRRARAAYAGPTRVRRGPDAGPVAWPRGAWPLTVTAVCHSPVDDYLDNLLRWAWSVRTTLDQYQPESPSGSPSISA